MVTTTWVVPSAVFFTSIIGWQYFVGHRSVPDGKCYVQYMESAIFNSLLQLGYFWATLVVVCALYTGIYRVALRLHRESAARRHNMASVTARATQHLGPTSTTRTTSAYKLVATAPVSAACQHVQRDDRAVSAVVCLSDSSLSEHDVKTRRHNDANDVAPLLSLTVSGALTPRRSDVAIELQDVTQLDTTSSAMTFTVDDDDIRFADDVTEDDDDVDVVFRDHQVTSTSADDINLRYLHHYRNHQQQKQQQSGHVASRDSATRSLLSSAPDEIDMCRHSVQCRQSARVDTAGVPTRRRFCSHRRLSSRRRQRRSKATTRTTCEWHSSSQVIDKLSARLRHFTRITRFLLSCRGASRAVSISRGSRPVWPSRPLPIISDHRSIRRVSVHGAVFCQSVRASLSQKSTMPTFP